MILTYCALLFQTITFWDGSEVIDLSIKTSCPHALRATEELNYTHAEYGHEVVTWGATLKTPQEAPAKELLTLLSYVVSFNGDGGVCR